MESALIAVVCVVDKPVTRDWLWQPGPVAATQRRDFAVWGDHFGVNSSSDWNIGLLQTVRFTHVGKN